MKIVKWMIFFVFINIKKIIKFKINNVIVVIGVYI